VKDAMTDAVTEAAQTPSADSTQPLVRARGISKTFDVSAAWLNRVIERKPRQLLHAVDEVSFDINRGETLALVGESGCGKSTVARMLVGLYKPSQGSIEVDGQSISTLVTREGQALRRRLQMIFQDPYASLNPRWKVADIVAEPIRVHKLITDEPAIAARVAQLLGQVGMAGADAQKFPHQFSGGQRQRISIARALASQAEFLVCDEPTSALDVSVQAQVLNLMRDLQRKHGLTYLFISHNLAVVHHVADRVGVMYLGRIVELAPKKALFAKPQHPYTQMLLDAIPDIEMTGKARTPVAGEVPNPLNPPSGCTFHPRCPQANERCKRERPVLKPAPEYANSVGAGLRTGAGANSISAGAGSGSGSVSADAVMVACHAVEERRIAFTRV
jgi:peptide/nickel transport system ATP-binding protein